MARPRKPVEAHKLDGTYRADRHGGAAEVCVSGYLEVPASLTAPANIKDKYCREHYKHHVNLLARLKILTLSDMPEIDMMYGYLQEYRRIGAALSKLSPADGEYGQMARTLLKFGARFSETAAKYCVSPSARNRLRIEALAIKKEEERQAGPAAKLIGRKKA
jgi:hypothetical protein